MKKIILAITPDMGFYECFNDNLKYLDFELFLITVNPEFKYKNLKDRLINFYKKKFLNDRTYKSLLHKKYNLIEHTQKLKEAVQSDYSLTIRADIFDEKILKLISQKSNKNYSYQWDGLARFPSIYNLIHLFTKFYIFDKNDAGLNNSLIPVTNFYFDCYNETIFIDKEPEFDVYFIGSYDNRISKLIEICEVLHNKGLKLNIMICNPPIEKYEHYKYLKFIKKPLSYRENLEMVAKSKMLIDLHHENLHQGLSFRTFESLGYNKKLITTNSIIEKYDFYNSSNIFIYNSNEAELDNFIEKPYTEIDKTIKEKYSFSNWIKFILNIDNHRVIEVP